MGLLIWKKENLSLNLQTEMGKCLSQSYFPSLLFITREIQSGNWESYGHL